MRKSSPNIRAPRPNRRRRPETGFTLVELLVVVVVTAVLMAGFTGFYLSQQRALRHDEIEIETSQALRTALEQMARDIRSANKNLTYDYLTSSGGASPTPGISTSAATQIEFTLDADDDAVTSTNLATEHKGFCLTSDASGSTCSPATSGVLAELDAPSGSYFSLADNIDVSAGCNNVMFKYYDVNGTSPPAGGKPITRVDICLTAVRPVIGGLPIVRTEKTSVQLRNVR